MGAIGFPELVVILFIVLLLFGVGRVSQVGKELGSAISAFRKGLNEGSGDDKKEEVEDSSKKA